MSDSIHWKRIFLGGFFTELALFAVVLPLDMVNQEVAYRSAQLLVLASPIGFAYWAARPLRSRFVLHGTLVAAVASLIYVALTTALRAPVPLLLHLSHGLLGGTLGAKFAEQRTSN